MTRHVLIPADSDAVAEPEAESTDWRDDPFPEQRTFLADDAKRKAALCGRRAGKTEALGYWMIDGALDSPGEQSLYIALSRANCRRLLWTTMQRIQRRHPSLPFALREVDGQLTARFDNGHDIWLAGCKDRSEMEKFRGPRYRRVAIDEAGSFGSYLEELVEDVLEPALMDLDGEIAMSGSPPALPQGYFYRATTGDGGPKWATHHWTVLDNPFMQPPYRKTTAAEWLARKRADNCWTEEHPRYVREYLGRWVKDLESLVFPFDRQRNGFYGLPAAPDGRDYLNGSGLDFGFVDSTAWVAGSWVRDLPTLWLRESTAASGLIPSSVAVRTLKWRERWPGKMVGDAGGIGKAYLEEMTQRFGVPIIAAQKHDKRVAIEMFRGDLLAGTVKAHCTDCQSLIDEWSRIQWNEAHTEIDERCIDHEAHAALYLHRDVRLSYKPQEEDPAPGTEAAKRREMDRIQAAVAKKMQAEQRRRRQSERWGGRG